MKLDRYLTDRRIDLSEAKDIERKAVREGGPAAGIAPKTQQAITAVLARGDVFIEPEARAVLEAIVAIPVLARPADPTARSPLFASDEPLTLKLRADFTTLFATRATTGRSEGVSATVELPSPGGAPVEVVATVRTRGQTSLATLPEPKLKLKLDKASREATVFERDGSVELGVQGGASGKDSMGRLLSPAAVAREAAVYAMLEELGLAVPRTRLANVEYVDTKTGATRSQLAFFVEDIDALATRFLGDEGLEVGNYGNDDQRPDAQATLQSKDVIMLHLAQALVGNRDYTFDVTGNLALPTVTSKAAYMHNAKFVMRPDPVNANQGEGLPVLTDFDLTLMVLQGEVGQWYSEHSAEGTAAFLQEKYWGQPLFDAAKQFVGRSEAAKARLAAYPLDDASKAFITQRLNAFVATFKHLAR